MINFYHMKGCPHCVLANTELQSLIDSGKVKKLPMEDAANKGVKGFPFFEYVDADGIVLKTSTGWGGKQNLFNNLGYIETFENYHPEHIFQDYPEQNFQDQNYKEEFKICKEGFSENYEHESMPNYHTGAGYSKLSNCWVKRPDYTA